MSTTEQTTADQGAPPRTGLEPIGECSVLRDVVTQPGIETLEGTMMPLLSGATMRSHMITMHPGQYCYAHPHPTESIIYTVAGRWVFCTIEDGEEKRIEIGAGDLFHMAADVPTGFETPFDEAASILIVKVGDEDYEQMWAGISDARDHIAEDAEGGAVFRLADLPADHAARTFADTA